VKVVAFNGSARREGNTALMIGTIFEELEAEGIETELVSLAGERIRGCMACGWCRKKPRSRCKHDDDVVNDCIAKMLEADGIILGSPTYFSDVSAEMKALIDRSGYVTRGAGIALRRKVGAAVVAAHRGGAIHAFDTLNHFFLINEMIVPGSDYWNDGIGSAKGEVAEDEEGLKTMRTLGRNMAWLLQRIHAIH